jgi:hypothetical protein
MHTMVQVATRVIATCVHFAELFQERRGFKEMTSQIYVLHCRPDVFLFALLYFENKLAQELLQESYGRQKIPMDPAAKLWEHHAPFTNGGYVTRDCFIPKNSFGARNLANTRDENPTPQIFRDDNPISLNNMCP